MFNHKYILKTVKFIPNEAMERGKKLHKSLERDMFRAASCRKPVCEEVKHVWPIVTAFATSHKEVRVEEQVALDRKFRPCSWFDKKTWLRGVFDVIGFNGEASVGQKRHVSVIDWKTGQYRPNEDQLLLYNWIIMLRWAEVKTVTSALVFIDHEKAAPLVVTKREDMQNISNSFMERVEDLKIAEERDRWPSVKNWGCRFCNVAECQFSGGASPWRGDPR